MSRSSNPSRQPDLSVEVPPTSGYNQPACEIPPERLDLLDSADLDLQDQEEKDLLLKVAKYPSINDSDPHRRLLWFLGCRSQRPECRHEKALRFAMYGERAVKISASVQIGRLVAKIDDFFANEGGRERRRMSIDRGQANQPRPKNLYLLRFVHKSPSALEAFWQDHLDSAVETQLVYGEPLFTMTTTRDGMLTFTRKSDVNKPEEVSKGRGEICWPFVTLGDLLGALEVTRFLSARKIQTTVKGLRADSGLKELFDDGATGHENVCLLGSTRVLGPLGIYQDEERFRFKLDITKVLDTITKKPEKEIQVGQGRSVPVLVTRRKGFRSHWVTMVGSNHGRAVYRVCQILTNEDEMSRLFSDPKLANWSKSMPEEFQILLRTEVLDGETVAGHTTLVNAFAVPQRQEVISV